MVQSYFDRLYQPFAEDIHFAKTFGNNETYGEIYYYSAAKLFRYLQITEKDHFLDIGSGLGKVVFQAFFTTEAQAITGIEINASRHDTASLIKKRIQDELPGLFVPNRALNLVRGDFLEHDLASDITLVYLCSTVFSFELLRAMGNKINTMASVQKVVSFRKLPYLDNFSLHKRLFVHCSWDKVPCYIYVRTKA
jgi:16S rRNA A1518/A1519 N6-dimethyltransferase RsmA/KsgA/DIM1 with predicted DNA glycosylase/AP lyase activity